MDAMNRVEVLLVEDNPTDAELTIRALKGRNLANSLVWVKDGVEALDFLFARGNYEKRGIEHYPHVILLDLKLPKLNGIEVLREIKNNEKTRHIPVVALTSSKEQSDLKECYDLGVNSYVAKPVEFDEFSKTVTDLGLYWLLCNKTPEE